VAGDHLGSATTVKFGFFGGGTFEFFCAIIGLSGVAAATHRTDNSRRPWPR